MEGFINPDEVLDKFNLKANMVAAEFGCGSGSFTIPLAKRLNEGLVYAIDIQQVSLSALRGRVLLENIKNIKIVHSDLEKPKGSTLSDSCLDLVFIPNVLFQAEDKNAIISEAERVLKNEARLVIIDWLPEAVQGPVKARVSPEEVKKIAKNIGLDWEREFEAGKYHYCLVFKKP